MLIIGRVMGWRVLWVYLASIGLLALGFGVGLDLIVERTGAFVGNPIAHVHGEGFLNQLMTWGSAGLLAFFITLHTYNKLVNRFMNKSAAVSGPNSISLGVDGMNCSHCVRTVTETLKHVPGVEAVQVSLATGRAQISGHGLDRVALVQAISGVGYTVRPEETPPPYDALDEK
jgi:copper chaperone CopZ